MQCRLFSKRFVSSAFAIHEHHMKTAQPNLFEFSDGSKLVRSTDKPGSWAGKTTVTRDVFEETRSLVRSSTVCNVLSKGHHPIKLNTKRHPDASYWCSGCGATGLQPPQRKSWE
jgi:hypothetical protein